MIETQSGSWRDFSWKPALRRNGYALLPGLVPSQRINRALTAIYTDLRSNYDSDRQEEYDNISYCPDLSVRPELLELLSHTDIAPLLDDLLGVKAYTWDRCQIAIRRAHNVETEQDPQPHLDGFATGVNGLRTGTIYTHTLLVGVFLSPVIRDFAGNLTVWPQSQETYTEHFRQRGKRAMAEPMPEPDIGEGVQLHALPGDAVLCHYALGHGAAVNVSDRDRIAAYFRVSFRDITKKWWTLPQRHEARKWHRLIHPWEDWNC